jgi:hypothetical protein
VNATSGKEETLSLAIPDAAARKEDRDRDRDREREREFIWSWFEAGCKADLIAIVWVISRKLKAREQKAVGKGKCARRQLSQMLMRSAGVANQPWDREKLSDANGQNMTKENGKSTALRVFPPHGGETVVSSPVDSFAALLRSGGERTKERKKENRRPVGVLVVTRLYSPVARRATHI